MRKAFWQVVITLIAFYIVFEGGRLFGFKAGIAEGVKATKSGKVIMTTLDSNWAVMLKGTAKLQFFLDAEGKNQYACGILDKKDSLYAVDTQGTRFAAFK